MTEELRLHDLYETKIPRFVESNYDKEGTLSYKFSFKIKIAI